MSPASEQAVDRPLVVVLDTSVLIAFKKIVPITQQWALLGVMTGLVQEGRLAFPKQVVKELSLGQHPDAPGAWIASKLKGQHPQPAETSLARVLGVAQLVDVEATAEREAADPYLVAMALEIREAHPGGRVVIATEDVVDRMPSKESIGTACERLQIERWSAEQFVEWIRAWLEDPPGTDGDLALI